MTTQDIINNAIKQISNLPKNIQNNVGNQLKNDLTLLIKEHSENKENCDNCYYCTQEKYCLNAEIKDYYRVDEFDISYFYGCEWFKNKIKVKK